MAIAITIVTANATVIAIFIVIATVIAIVIVIATSGNSIQVDIKESK